MPPVCRRQISTYSRSVDESTNAGSEYVTLVVCVSAARMFCAAGSSVGDRIVCVALKLPCLLIVPFQTPIDRIAEPATIPVLGICVFTANVQLPAANAVPPARSCTNPLPVGVALGVVAVVVADPGRKAEEPGAFAPRVLLVATFAAAGAAVTSRHEPASVEAVLDRYSGDG